MTSTTSSSASSATASSSSSSTEMEVLQTSLKCATELRSMVGDFWKFAGEGAAGQRHPGAAATAVDNVVVDNVVAAGIGGGDNGREKKFLSEMKQALDGIAAKMRDLEARLNRPVPLVQMPLGNTMYLNLDPAVESVQLYSSLATSYKWWDKTHDYAGGAASLLSQNSLNRSYGKVMKSRRRPTSTSYSAPPQALDNLISQMSRMFGDMSFQVTRPNGTKSSVIVEVKLERLLRASLIFKGLMIDWVMIRGFGEASNMTSAQAGEGTPPPPPDVWTESRYLVFRRITDNANAAMLNFQSPVYPELAVTSFMTYLHSFVTLFTDKCRKCNYHLRNNIPPTWREFKTLEPFHEDCRP